MICILKVIHYFWLMFLTIYQLDPAKFVSALGLAWQTALKKTEVKLKLLTGIIKWLKRHERRNMSHNSSIC